LDVTKLGKAGRLYYCYYRSFNIWRYIL